MTTATFYALVGPTASAIATVLNQHCTPPTYKPGALVGGHMACPNCGSRLNFRVTPDGQTYGRCVAVSCIRWSNQ